MNQFSGTPLSLLQKLLDGLQKLKSQGPQAYGKCINYNVHGMAFFNFDYSGFGNYSGDSAYPIAPPHDSELDAQECYDSGTDLWSVYSEYGRTRWGAVNWLIGLLEDEIAERNQVETQRVMRGGR